MADHRHQARRGCRDERVRAVAGDPDHKRPHDHLEQRSAQAAQHPGGPRRGHGQHRLQKDARRGEQKRPVEHVLGAQTLPQKRDGQKRDEGDERRGVGMGVAHRGGANLEAVAQKAQHHGRQHDGDRVPGREHLRQRTLHHARRGERGPERAGRHAPRGRPRGKLRPRHAQGDRAHEQKARSAHGPDGSQKLRHARLRQRRVQREGAEHAQGARAHHGGSVEQRESARKPNAHRRADELGERKPRQTGQPPIDAVGRKLRHHRQDDERARGEQRQAERRARPQKQAHVHAAAHDPARDGEQDDVHEQRADAHGQNRAFQPARLEHLPVAQPDAPEHA